MKLEVKNLRKRYGQNLVLDGISLTFESGNIYGLFGRNGAGKSTLFRCINDLLPYDDGSILLDGAEYRDLAKEKRKLLAIANEDNLFPADANIKAMACAYAYVRNIDEEKLLSDIDRFSIPARKKWEKLSTGERTMLKNVFAINSGASFIFLDEPVLGLDAINRDELYRRLLKDFSEEKTYIISSHIIDEVASFASYIYFLDSRRIVLEGESELIQQQSFILSGSSVDLAGVKGNFSIISRGNRLGSEYMCVLGKIEEVPASVKMEKTDLQQLFIEMTKGGNGK